LGNVIGFRAHDDEVPSTMPHIFDFAIVPDAVFCNETCCPHCQSLAHPELIEPVESSSYSNVTLLGDLMMCTDCEGMYLVVESPILPITKPVMTRWSVPHQIRPGYYQNGKWHQG
jgi:hypothetical protein